ncbi:NUDIX hydrolase [Spirulina sp. CS-785/01]|uniref:NUDIX hydrolase n=1 Tax=Spirulina sp. CS-785/01 TaxID=3021716 RepID=UPI00232ACD3C|nr:NUDIX hydrolase [Spirulina sp. CS-785/01]MDB9312015.1 NUDIX hydrolase [Spirulina sp. CS-785/01]
MSYERQVAIAILYQKGRFLMQLRDNLPHIPAAGCWGFFGGHLEPGETPEEGLQRELQEEINYTIRKPPIKLGEFPNEEHQSLRHVFAVPLLVPLHELQLNEGWDMALLCPEDIVKGEFYSHKARQIRPLGFAHRKFLLDLIESNLVDWQC